jgi:beta-galactosidase
MKRSIKHVLTVLLALVIIPLGAQTSNSRRTTSFDAGWKFARGDYKGAQRTGYNDASWRTLDLPHDWSIEGENLQAEPGGGNVGYFPAGTGWYRKSFDMPALDKNRQVRIEFDGVYENSEVWLNGDYLGKRPSGYASFSYDLTRRLKAKGNVIAVKVDNSHQPNSRWYSGSGIYRHVRIVETHRTHFEKWGVFVRTKEIGERSAVLAVDVSVENLAAATEVVLKHVLYAPGGTQVAAAQVSLPIGAGAKETLRREIAVDNPALWSTDSPNLYTLASYLYAEGEEIDCELTSVGIRTIRYTADSGFLLNEERVKMKGVNLHHEAGAVGAAVPERVWERRIEILKSGGCNAIRTAHNPPAPEFLDLCDRHGMLVMDEAFDEWLAGKRDFSYKLHFAEWYEEDLRSMVMRDRNHPSVVMWSIGNEVPDQSTKEGPGLARRMIGICHDIDPTRPVTSGNDNIAAGKNATTDDFLSAFAGDITGYNYPDRYRERRELLYVPDKSRYPERLVVATETGGVGGSRVSVPTEQTTGRIRASSLSSRLVDVEQRWKFTLLNDYVIGDFMWTGIDYYGETFWPQRGANSGYLDNCGFKKDGYYFFKSIWTPEPVVHLATDWNKSGREGEVMSVVCFTNCREVELFVNGRSYGVKTFEFPRTGNTDDWVTYAPDKVFTSTADLHLTWDVAYEPGEIIAVGKRDGKEYIGRVVTSGAPAKLRLTVDRDVVRAHPSDVVHATVEVLDKDDNLVPYADNLITFDAVGARIIGVESGNFADLSSPKASQRKAFGGMCLAIIQAGREDMFTIRAFAEGLDTQEVSITVRP